MSTPEMEAAKQEVRDAVNAKVERAVADALAAAPKPEDPQPLIDAARAEDVADVKALAAELNPPA